LDRRLIWQLALRYLRGKRSANAVPVLSRISMVAVAVSAAAMIIVFSVFNGLEFLVKDMYKAFYPDVKVTAARGKFFLTDSTMIYKIRQVPGVTGVTQVIEDNVLVNNNEQQKVIVLKGIEPSYMTVNGIDSFIDHGADSVSVNEHTAIVGNRILMEVGGDLNNIYSTIELLYFNPSVTNPEADPLSAFQSLKLHPAGSFKVSDEFDTKYVLAPLPLVQELFFAPGRISSIEISTTQGNADEVQNNIAQLLGPAYKAETRYEQNRSIYVIMAGEKWAIYFILVMVLLIASFNLVGALSMLVLEKQQDIAILKAMGAAPVTIRRIFLLEGILWSLVGGSTGILLGAGISLLQLQFGFIKIGGSFLVDAFPVRLKASDFGLVFITILIVGLLTSWYPSRRATRSTDPALKST
jgi:lipoprotein-releasing system permease protein